MMSRTTDHKRASDLYRCLASIPTSGGYRADRELLALADKLDREIAISKPGADREPTRAQTARR
jgi:hypothetical protein